MIVSALRENRYSVDYISEVNPGLSDHEIVKTVSQNSAILITEDSDFGEWVFVHG
jgi:predicted nuclease of predicted toxin-antitoxin system